jgi:hypothetical protein
MRQGQRRGRIRSRRINIGHVSTKATMLSCCLSASRRFRQGCRRRVRGATPGHRPELALRRGTAPPRRALACSVRPLPCVRSRGPGPSSIVFSPKGRGLAALPRQALRDLAAGSGGKGVYPSFRFCVAFAGAARRDNATNSLFNFFASSVSSNSPPAERHRLAGVGLLRELAKRLTRPRPFQYLLLPEGLGLRLPGLPGSWNAPAVGHPVRLMRLASAAKY